MTWARKSCWQAKEDLQARYGSVTLKKNRNQAFNEAKSGGGRGFPYGGQVPKDVITRWRDGVDVSTVKKLIKALETKDL